MKRMYIVAIDSIFILAMLTGCSPTASPAGNGGLPSNAQNYQVEIINLTEPVYETIRTESIDQPNCNGTGDVDNVVERTMGINHSIELGLGLTVDIDGKLELFGTGVDLGAAISSELGYQYGVTESISRSITVRAAPNTHVVHTVKLSEVWESGTARVTSNGESIDIPFRSRANFSIDLIESAPVICPTGQSTTTTQTQQYGLDCSFIDKLLTKADVIQNLYDGQSLAGVQARLIYPVDVPAGWIVQEGSKDYYGPVHFDSGVVASFWSPNSCRPLNIGNNSTSAQPTSNPLSENSQTAPLIINDITNNNLRTFEFPSTSAPSSCAGAYIETGMTIVDYEFTVPQSWAVIIDSWKAEWSTGSYQNDGILIIIGEWQGKVTVNIGAICAVPANLLQSNLETRRNLTGNYGRPEYTIP